MTVKQVIDRIWADPWGVILSRWNYKSAMFGAFIRGVMFFLINRKSGRGLAAMLAEFVFFTLAAGFFGAVTQAFRNAKPGWQARLTVISMVVCTMHTTEFLIHHFLVHTPKALAGTLSSICFTILSTTFTFFIMSRGAMVVGEDGEPFLLDMKRMPALVLSFVSAPFRAIVLKSGA